jgi:hypothetical protein
MSNQWPSSDPRIPRLASLWFPSRSWHWSANQPAGPRVAVVTSRLPRLIDPHAPWLVALLAAVAKVHRERKVLVAGHGTAGESLLRRAAQRARFPFIELCESSAIGVADELPATESTVVRGWPIRSESDPSAERSIADWQRTPERDQAAIAWADKVMALGVRPGGNLLILLRERLRAGVRGVLLADLPGLQPHAVREELLSLGAELWSVDSRAIEFPLPFGERGEIRPLPSAEGWDFLTHTTRACPGPWPEQSDDDYLDSLLDGREDADHSALGTLIRIVTQRRLIASNRLIRGGHPVVSFTAVPLAELPQMHRYRGHLARWDFESFGLCLRREWLVRRGVRRVLYGGEAEWTVTPAADQPFFQCVRELDRTTWSDGAPPDTIDWSTEREWRHLGDLDLSDATREDVLLFVPTREAADRLAAVSPWPITILDAGSGA